WTKVPSARRDRSRRARRGVIAPTRPALPLRELPLRRARRHDRSARRGQSPAASADRTTMEPTNVMDRVVIPASRPPDPAHVYVVDDEEIVCTALARWLRAEGFTASTHRSAIEFLEACDPGIHGCALVDMVMPGLNGLELQLLVKSRGWST